MNRLFLMALALGRLPSCVLQSALHRPVFDWGREGEALLVEGEPDVLMVCGEWELAAANVPVYRAGGQLFIAAHPARYVRRNRSWLLTLEDDHPSYRAEPTGEQVLYGEVKPARSGYLERTQSPWQDKLPAGAVLQSGKLLVTAERRLAFRSGVLLEHSELQAGPHALWAYPLGTVLAVADVPLTVVWHGVAFAALPVVYAYDKLTVRPYPRNQEPPVQKSRTVENGLLQGTHKQWYKKITDKFAVALQIFRSVTAKRKSIYLLEELWIAIVA